MARKRNQARKPGAEKRRAEAAHLLREERQRLTDAIVKRLPVPERGYRVTRDADTRGFAVRVTAAGARSFVLDYYIRGRDRSITVGRFPDWSVTAARARAQALRREIDVGNDPLADIEAERTAPTVAELIERFREEHLPRKRPSTAADYERLIANHIAPHFGKHAKVADVTFADIDRLHRKITKTGAPYRANRAISVVSKMFALAVRWGMRETNPVRGIERNTEYTRRRYLTTEELPRLLAALAEHPEKQAADAIRLLLLTGARRGEVLSMRYADVDLGRGLWSKPASSTKQKQAHEVPLSAPARQILSDIQAEHRRKRRHGLPTYVFSSISEAGHLVDIKHSWRAITKAAGIEGLRLHDLRHSHASFLVSGGASLPLIAAMLGHANVATTHRYSHLHQDPLRAAAEHVGKLVEGAGKPAREAVPLKRGGRPT
jgi:integrase